MLSGLNVTFRELPVTEIRPNDYNPNRMSPGQFETLKQTIHDDGFVGVVLVNQSSDEYTIIDGEHRWRAAVDLKIKTIPCAVTELPPERAKSLTIKLNQIHGEWVPDLLVDLVVDLPEPIANLGFADGELEEMLKQVNVGMELEEFDITLNGGSNSDGSFMQQEHYIGFNLSRERRDLLERALTYVGEEQNDVENPRAGSLEVILRHYIQSRSRSETDVAETT